MIKIKQNRTYKDLDFMFNRHPSSGDVSLKNDVAAIKQSVKNLVLMKRKPFHPEIQSGVYDLLFAQQTLMTKISLQDEIQKVLEQFEPRIQVNEVEVKYIQVHGVEIIIRFTIINTLETVNYSFIVERTR